MIGSSPAQVAPIDGNARADERFLQRGRQLRGSLPDGRVGQFSERMDEAGLGELGFINAQEHIGTRRRQASDLTLERGGIRLRLGQVHLLV